MNYISLDCLGRCGKAKTRNREVNHVRSRPEPGGRGWNYYARVIEILTPRWTAYDAYRFGVKPLIGKGMIVTERANTSPIWFTY
jgi:hypothetical protein